jgi:hypothetical protein
MSSMLCLFLLKSYNNKKRMTQIAEVESQLANYHICPICMNPIEVEKYEEHRKTHGKTDDKTDISKLKLILDGSENSWKKKADKNPITLFFEIARRVFSETEKVDTSSWNYVFDNEIPNSMTFVPIVPTPCPPVMYHPRFVIKDKEKFEQLIEKYKGTEEEKILKAMVSTTPTTVVVCGREWGRLSLQWISEGKSSSDIMMLTVYFFLHEMYHIVGLGEKDSTTKASIAMYRIFGRNVGIPEHEIDRWKYEEKQKGQKGDSN